MLFFGGRGGGRGVVAGMAVRVVAGVLLLLVVVILNIYSKTMSLYNHKRCHLLMATKGK
jgi:hypothetical protein